MSCEIYIDDNAEEYEITVSGDSTCDEIDLTIEVGGEKLPIETDPVFLAHPVYSLDATDVTNLQNIDATDVTNLNNITAANILNFHAPNSDAETASTIGTLLGTQSAATPGSSDVFPFVQAVGNTLKKITLTNLAAALNAEAGADPLFMASPAYGITTGDIDNWDTAYGWGDHSAQGYATTGDLLDYSTTGHDHDTLYDSIGAASGEVGQHEIDYDHDLIGTAVHPADLYGYIATGDNISLLTNDAGYITSGEIPESAVTFLELTDTPSAYTGYAGYYVAVASGEGTLEFVEAPDGGSSAPTAFAGVTPVSATGYTLELDDAGKLIRCANAAAILVTVPASGAVDYDDYTFMNVIQAGAGQVTVTGDSGVTVNAYGGAKTGGQYWALSLVKIDTDTWDLYGGIA